MGPVQWSGASIWPGFRHAGSRWLCSSDEAEDEGDDEVYDEVDDEVDDAVSAVHEHEDEAEQSDESGSTTESDISDSSSDTLDDLSWEDAEEIAELLHEMHTKQDPLVLRFTDLHAKVCSLSNFAGSPHESSEKRLEAIQMAWLELYQEKSS